GASTLVAPVVDAGANTAAGDTLKLDGTTAFSFDAAKVGTEFTNFEVVNVEGTVTLSGASSASAAWVNHGFVVGSGNVGILGNFTNNGTLQPGVAAGDIATFAITGNYSTTVFAHLNMD